MVAMIASGHLWSLNFVHVFSVLLWTGIDRFMGFVLGPILRVVDISACKAVLLRLTPAHTVPDAHAVDHHRHDRLVFG
jgi:hypothetical protein